MNVLSGILHLSPSTVQLNDLEFCQFKSPHWNPDYAQTYIEGPFGVISHQRFITPECANAPMPFRDPISGCVITGDLFLTDRDRLISDLNACPTDADARLVLLAYLKWGTDFPRHLCGVFLISLWDPIQHLFLLTTDIYSQRPCHYYHQPGQSFYFANTVSPFRKWKLPLTLNPLLFTYFSLDLANSDLTCYTELRRLPPASTLIIYQNSLTIKPYWSLKKRRFLYRTRQAWLSAFKPLFEHCVHDSLRSLSPISAQISGGLDSTSVACAAAKILSQTNDLLFGFSAIPFGLDGPSPYPNCMFHELPLIEDTVSLYPNIHLTAYRDPPLTDCFDQISPLFPYIDQPIRNIQNFDWFLATLRSCQSHNSRLLLMGSRGNSSISWPGEPRFSVLKRAYHRLKFWIKPFRPPGGYYQFIRRSFISSKKIKSILYSRVWNIDYHFHGLKPRSASARQSSIYPFYLWYGVAPIDPTADRRLIEFCYSVPQWVYRKGPEILDHRLLVREGLEGLVPESVLKNPFKGEQAADWYLGYNLHFKKWKSELEHFYEKNPTHFLFKIFDHTKLMALFQPLSGPGDPNEFSTAASLIRYISTIKFSEFLKTTQ